MLHTCVILNGPPGCGKDTLGNMLEPYGFKHFAFKDQLYVDTAEHFGVDVAWFTSIAQSRELKEVAHPALRIDEMGYALTPREALIYTSENVIKPQFGEAYYGKAGAINCLMEGASLAVFSDGGFGPEIEPLMEHYQNVVIFQLYRDGYDFEGDSRRYVEGFPNTYQVQLVDGDPEAAIMYITTMLEGYVFEYENIGAA